jgi:hypothetical protein
LEGNLPRKSLKLPGHHKAASSAAHKHTYKQRVDAAVQQDVATIHDMLQAAKAETGTRGIGKVWPCPLEDGPASAAMLAAAAAAAAAEGNGSSRHGLRSPGGKSGVGSLAAAAAAAAAASAGAAKRSVLSAARAGEACMVCSSLIGPRRTCGLSDLLAA